MPSCPSSVSDFLRYASSASDHRCSFSYRFSLSSTRSSFCAYTSIPLAASGWLSWLLMWMSFSTQASGSVLNCCSL